MNKMRITIISINILDNMLAIRDSGALHFLIKTHQLIKVQNLFFLTILDCALKRNSKFYYCVDNFY
jgi:hypothetical protein